MKIRQSIIGIALLLAFLCSPAVKAQDGLRGALSRATRTGRSLAAFPVMTAADFDNDQKPDAAILREAGLVNGARAFRIEIHLTASSDNTITFSSAESGLAISALDVNRDGAPDIVVQKSFTHERLQVYLNDGHGNFYKARAEDFPTEDPSAPAWRAESSPTSPVFCLPATRNPDQFALWHISMFRLELSRTARLAPEGVPSQSAARAPCSSRAPPSFISL